MLLYSVIAVQIPQIVCTFFLDTTFFRLKLKTSLLYPLYGGYINPKLIRVLRL